MSVKTLRINDKDVSAREGETLLQIARENDIYIPTLCELEGLSLVGACRLCLVEVSGWRGLHAACVTKVQEGMEVFTETKRLKEYRRLILEMLFVENNHVCAICVSNGHCDLQTLARRVGMKYTNLAYRHPEREIDLSHQRFGYDAHRCVLCTRCVRVCDEIEGAHTWDVFGRGINSHVITDLDQDWGDSPTCTDCGKCVHVCPTGALFDKGKSAAEMVKRREFLPYLNTMRETKKNGSN
jgi:bidirectional [NiFe] hydrogenase diaphorase subunit